MRLPSKRTTFWLLMAGSAVVACLPAPAVRSRLDPALAPLSGWLYQSSQNIRDRTSQLTLRPADSQTLRQLQQDLDERDRAVAMLQRENERLLEELTRATGLPREQLAPRGRLIPAQVLSRDAVAWRETALLDIGRNTSIKPKQWAAGGIRTFVDRGQDTDLKPNQWTILPLASVAGQKLFRRLALVGQVESVTPVTSRVRLLTDPDSRVAAQLVDGLTGKPGPTIDVIGRGPGLLVAERVMIVAAPPGSHNQDTPPAKACDLVVSAVYPESLPAQLLIGTVRKVDNRKDDPLAYRVTIEPAADYSRMTRLFVVDPGGGQSR